VTGLEKLSSLVARLAFVQSIIFALQAIDDQFGNLPTKRKNRPIVLFICIQYLV
jgi:hypothetical protein